jgi:heme/copper-type cytochrome/quinol oxidase subunit 2
VTSKKFLRILTPLFSGRIAAALRAVLVAAMLLAVAPGRAWACAACYGQSDSPMAKGMNWGILSLLGIIGLVLVGVAGFFVFLARKSAGLAAASAAAQLVEAADSKPV